MKAPVFGFLALFATHLLQANTNVDLGLRYLNSRLRSPGLKIVDITTLDEQGNIYVTGTLTEQSRFDSTIVDCSGTNSPGIKCRDFYLGKYDRQRKLVWLKHAPNAGGTALAVHGIDSIVLGGRIWGSTRIDDKELLHTRKESGTFLARFDATGKTLWLHQFDQASANDITGLAVDANGNILAAGVLNGSMDFEGTTLTPRGKSDGFLAKYTATGKFLWVRQHGDSIAKPASVAVDQHGDSYVAGTFWDSFAGMKSRPGSGIYLIKYDEDGKVLWATNADSDVEVTRRRSPEGVTAHNVILDRESNPYVVGFLGGTRQFGSTTVTQESSIYGSVYFAKYSSTGTFDSVRQFRVGDGSFAGAVSIASVRPLPNTKRTTDEKRINVVGEYITANAKALSEQASAAAGAATASPNVPIVNDSGASLAPLLYIFKAESNIVLVWSAAAPKELLLEETDMLMPLPIWTSVAAPRSLAGAFVTVVLPIDRAAKFYRLRKP